jgi:hypothetical protein
MSRNIEIKARIESVDSLMAKAVALADEGPIEIAQDDTFFRCDAGRLKLRAFSNGTGELIFYRRANQLGPKESLRAFADVCTRRAPRSALLGVRPSRSGQRFSQVGGLPEAYRRRTYAAGTEDPSDTARRAPRLPLSHGFSIRVQDSAARPSDTMMAAATEAHPERAVKPTSRSITSMW